MKTVGERIKEARTKLLMSQVDFADQIGVTKQTLYKYENNIITNIPSDKIESAAKIANVSPAYLMGWEKEPSKLSFPLSNKEENVIIAYRTKPEMQPAVDKLLGIDDSDTVTVFRAARSTDNHEPEIKQVPRNFIQKLKDAPETDEKL